MRSLCTSTPAKIAGAVIVAAGLLYGGILWNNSKSPSEENWVSPNHRARIIDGDTYEATKWLKKNNPHGSCRNHLKQELSPTTNLQHCSEIRESDIKTCLEYGGCENAREAGKLLDHLGKPMK